MGLCGWGGMGVSQGEASQREDGCREAGRMLRCVWVRLSTTQMRRAGDSWRRGAETGVVQAAWCMRCGLGFGLGFGLQKEDGGSGAEAGRMLRCVWMRLSTMHVRRRRHMGASRRDMG